jgi:hypothetical protein
MFRHDFGYLTPPTSPRRTEEEDNEIVRLENAIRNTILRRVERKEARKELRLKLYGYPDLDSPHLSEMTETDDDCISYSSSEEVELSSSEDENESLERWFQAKVSRSITAAIAIKN